MVCGGLWAQVQTYVSDNVSSWQEGFVKATFNAAKVGSFTKTVTVVANGEGDTVLLTIKGTVVE